MEPTDTFQSARRPDAPANRDIAVSATDEPSPHDAAVVDAGLDAFNRESADIAAIRPLAAFARLPSGDIVAGAVGLSWGTACELRQLWVRQDCRGRGLGTRVIQAFEAHARARGCALVFLDTLTFQAPDFYRKLGYTVACEFAGMPDGVSKILMRKELS